MPKHRYAGEEIELLQSTTTSGIPTWGDDDSNDYYVTFHVTTPDDIKEMNDIIADSLARNRVIMGRIAKDILDSVDGI